MTDNSTPSRDEAMAELLEMDGKLYGDVSLKNKLVAAILSHPPETMTEAERKADELLLAMARAQGVGAGRRAIDSAPKDGTRFLAGQWFVEQGKPVFDCAVTWWSHTRGFSGDTRIEQPTHWRPLLPAPSTKGEG